MARVLLGVSGGIAAYKACEVCRLLVKAGHDVVPLVTPGAERFVTAETFRALARRPAAEDVYLHLTRADLLLVAPCTANTLAKLAHGLADNVLTEAALAHRGPILVAPAMNPRMWAHPATRANAETLRTRGVVLVGPDEGETAEGELGVGRMSEPDEIVRAAEELLAGKSRLRGKHVLVSAGGTREPLDAVRFLGNRSSGRMGVALAAEARRRGAGVTLLASNLSVPAPVGVDVVETPSAADLEREALEHGPVADVVVMAAAVADFRPESVAASKLKKGSAAEPSAVPLVRNPDVLAELVTKRAPGQVVVGFAAETGDDEADVLTHARTKLARKGCDVLVVNDVSDGQVFGRPDNAVTVLAADGSVTELPQDSKDAVAAGIWVAIASQLSRGPRS
jgi:phosphopantothenoylcysteine decarboxylase / phosphopantothenate---cysteine ligase